MTTICPMLSALPPVDDGGRSVSRECIYEGCRFFDTAQRDCSLMMASRAMVRMAREAAERPATTPAAEPAGEGRAASPLPDLERPLNEMRRDLLSVTLETQGVVRETGQSAVLRITDLESRLAGMDEALARAMDERDGRLLDAMREMLRERPAGAPAAGPAETPGIAERLEALAERLQTPTPASPPPELLEALQAANQRLDDLPSRVGERMPHLDGLAQALDRQAARLQEMEERLEASLGSIVTRLEQARQDAAARDAADAERERAALEREQEAAARRQAQEQSLAETSVAVAQMAPGLGALQELQSRIAETLLEQMSLVTATARKLEQAMAGANERLDRSIDESMQLSQLVTLVKGETERTYAALRTIHEGSRSVIEAIETQLQRDQAEMKRRRHDEAMTCNNRGVALYYRGALEASLDALRQAVKANPEYAEAYNNMGLVLSRLGRGEEAVESFQQALKIDPRLGEAYNNLGFLYHTAAQFDRAVKMFDQAIQSAADSSVAYANLGNSFYKMKQSEKAVEAWRRALDLDPMNENARRGLRMFQQDASNN